MALLYDTGSENVIWISKNDKLPQRCCTCGMFTDRLVMTSHTRLHRQTVASEDTAQILLGCLLHLLLGPIGWLVSLLFHDSGSNSKTKTKTTKQKHKIKMPQCQLCSSQQKPEPVDVNSTGNRFAFQVHPEFMRRFEIANAPADK